VANTTEMLRIMRHAAQRLEEEDASAIIPQGAGAGTSWATEAREQARSADLAMTYAAVVLRMVAAAMDDEPGPVVPGTAVAAQEREA
jgi:hypothetical protein